MARIYQRLLQLLQGNRKIRWACVLIMVMAAGGGATYLYFHNPYSHPLPCAFYLITGFYCPGCGAGRACYSILHGEIIAALTYNPLLVIMLPWIGIYIVFRVIDWATTGENHVDRRLNETGLLIIYVVLCLYGILRNIPIFPFTLLIPGAAPHIL